MKLSRSAKRCLERKSNNLNLTKSIELCSVCEKAQLQLSLNISLDDTKTWDCNKNGNEIERRLDESYESPQPGKKAKKSVNWSTLTSSENGSDSKCSRQIGARLNKKPVTSTPTKNLIQITNLRKLQDLANDSIPFHKNNLGFASNHDESFAHDELVSSENSMIDSPISEVTKDLSYGEELDDLPISIKNGAQVIKNEEIVVDRLTFYTMQNDCSKCEYISCLTGDQVIAQNLSNFKNFINSTLHFLANK
jgi:hypothetical protein